jgi:flagellin
MADINLSHAVRSNLLSLQSTAANMAKTQERLATGLKVNSALDNPTNFFTASALNSRAGDMANLLDSMSSGIKTIEAADNGLKSITKTVETMQSTLRQARQDKTFKTGSFPMSAIDTTTLKTISFSAGAVGSVPTTVNINRSGASAEGAAAYVAPTAATPATYVGGVFAATTLGNTALTIGHAGLGASVSLNVTVGGTANDAVNEINAAISADSDTNGKIEAYLSGGSVALRTVGQVDGSITVAGAGNTIFGVATDTAGSDGKHNITVNGLAVSYGGSSLALATSDLNDQLKGTEFEAFNDGSALGIRAKVNGANTLTIGGPNAALFDPPTTGVLLGDGTQQSVDELVKTINAAFPDVIRASNDNGKLRVENLSTQALTVTGVNDLTDNIDGGTGTFEVGGNDVRKNLVTQFNELRDQLDKFSDDASFNGINLLRGDKLKLTFNETGTSTIEIQAKDIQGTATQINNAALNIDFVVASDFDSDTTLDQKLDELKGAMDFLRSQASSFGSNLSVVQNRTDFTKNMINTLETGAANLTLADTNEEAANLLALQTRQQLSSTALSMASQSDQAVLRLFG